MNDVCIYKKHLIWKYILVCLDLLYIISGQFLHILAFLYWENLNISHTRTSKKTYGTVYILYMFIRTAAVGSVWFLWKYTYLVLLPLVSSLQVVNQWLLPFRMVHQVNLDDLDLYIILSDIGSHSQVWSKFHQWNCASEWQGKIPTMDTIFIYLARSK